MTAAIEPQSGAYTWHDLASIMLVSTLAGAALSLSFPLLSLALSEAGASTAAIGWSAAGHGIGMLLTAPFIAGIIGRFGAIATMRVGLLTTAAILLLLPLHIDPWAWFFARIVMGGAGAAIFIVTESAVNAMVDDRNRGRVLGAYASFFCIGYASGPLIVAIAGASGWLPFMLGASLFLAGLWPAARAHGAERALQGSGQRFALSGMVTAFQRAPLPFIAIFLFGFVEMGLLSLLPVWATNRGIATDDAALMISVWVAGNILLQYPIGYLSDIWSKASVLALATLASIALIIPLFASAPGLWWIWPVLLLMGGTLGALYTLSLGLLGTSFRSTELTIANTLFIMSLETGVMTGPAIGGMVMIGAGNDHLLSLWIGALGILAVYAMTSVHKVGNIPPKQHE